MKLEFNSMVVSFIFAPVADCGAKAAEHRRSRQERLQRCLDQVRGPVRRIMDDAGVSFQTAELGKVDVGGGGAIAYIPAKYGMNVIDSGVPVPSMRSPWEVTSEADIYEARRGHEACLRDAS